MPRRKKGIVMSSRIKKQGFALLSLAFVASSAFAQDRETTDLKRTRSEARFGAGAAIVAPSKGSGGNGHLIQGSVRMTNGEARSDIQGHHTQVGPDAYSEGEGRFGGNAANTVNFSVSMRSKNSIVANRGFELGAGGFVRDESGNHHATALVSVTPHSDRVQSTRSGISPGMRVIAETKQGPVILSADGQLAIIQGLNDWNMISQKTMNQEGLGGYGSIDLSATYPFQVINQKLEAQVKLGYEAQGYTSREDGSAPTTHSAGGLKASAGVQALF